MVRQRNYLHVNAAQIEKIRSTVLSLEIYNLVNFLRSCTFSLDLTGYRIFASLWPYKIRLDRGRRSGERHLFWIGILFTE